MAYQSVQSLSRVWLFATPWTAACQASLSITNSWSLLRLTSIESVMPSNHLILCRPFLILLQYLPALGFFSSESVLCIRWPKYWSFSISLSNDYSRLISFRIDWFDWLIWPIGQICPDLMICIRNCLMNSWFSLWLRALYECQKSRQLHYYLLKNAIWNGN